MISLSKVPLFNLFHSFSVFPRELRLIPPPVGVAVYKLCLDAAEELRGAGGPKQAVQTLMEALREVNGDREALKFIINTPPKGIKFKLSEESRLKLNQLI